MTDPVKQFWDAQAATHGTSDLATAPDHYYRQLEIDRICEHLENGKYVLDVGCGNGYATLEFAQRFTASTFIGVDYSKEMINWAWTAKQERKLSNHDYINVVAFFVANVLELGNKNMFTADDKPTLCDIIVCTRVLINLKTWDEQKRALLEMKKVLKPNGKIILVENFVEGLNQLNTLRKKFDLHKIKQRWHNRYLMQKEFEPFALAHFTNTHKENIGNTYYLASRVIYAALAAKMDEEPRYDHPINEIASKLPSLGTFDYSPNWLYVLENKP